MRFLPSSAEGRVQKLKQNLVLDVYYGRGDFWKRVNSIRRRCRVNAEVGLPPPQLSPPCPEDDVRELGRWKGWLTETRRLVVPKRYERASDWDKFITACVLYDPLERGLEEFAEYGGITPEVVIRPGKEEESGEGLRVLAPPIEWIDTAGHSGSAIEKFYLGVIKELHRRDYEPYGACIWDTVSDIYNETNLEEELQTRLSEAEKHPRIAVSKDTSPEEVAKAASAIRATQEKNLGGRPSHAKTPCEEMRAIKYAAIYRDHNPTNPEDGRRRRWDHSSLAKEFGLGTGQSDEALKQAGQRYLRLGDRLRNEHKSRRTATSPQ